MKHLRTACVFAGLASGAGALAYAAPPANEPPPTAVYWVSASTTTGMMAQMMGSGGGRPSPQQMMAMMAHGGPPDPNAPQHSLRLQLGSLRHPAGPPAAEHDAPDGLGAGPVLPLLSPRPVAGPAPQEEEGPRPPAQYHQPQGRMLIYWGCGEHAPPNQPLVIDFAHVADAPQRFAALMRGLNVPPMHGPSAGRYPSYGEWPNERNSDPVPAAGSLAGPHVVKGDYSPEIRFTLSPGQDFMPPLRLTSNTPMRSGAVQLAWDALPTATGYFATVMGAQRGGGGGGETVVMWTSAERELAAFAAPDYISPGEARRLVGERAVLSPQTTSCVVPAEVAQAAQHGLLSMTAWGEEANFGYPARPQPPVWVVKVRYRSAASALLGQPNGFGGEEQRRNRPGFPGLGGLFPPH
ncbi:hypothetical protein [Phenylobacterium montanum]|uniref:Uncharacterized protein n=1 Tax=Phenylobacterium montanum TaxID=2823693 RepID=A0A975IT76_9CAUL|nr:hypothetical protein [Caulobacter sp. S6]QUD86493.1 hypothetical protein KCG34_15505 [Caulobacter sp. S6]